MNIIVVLPKASKYSALKILEEVPTKCHQHRNITWIHERSGIFILKNTKPIENLEKSNQCQCWSRFMSIQITNISTCHLCAITMKIKLMGGLAFHKMSFPAAILREKYQRSYSKI